MAVAKRLLPLALLLELGQPALAAPPQLCAAAKKPVERNSFLASEVEAVFGKAKFADAEADCTYPLEAFRYASADLLLVQEGAPGEACHGCGAALTAYVIQRVNGGLRPVRKFPKFSEIGSFDTIIDAWPIEIGGDDALAIEVGGMIQGYSSSSLWLFAFRGGALVDLGPKPLVTLDADNSGASDDPGKAISVQASWFFDSAEKDTLVVDYKIAAKGTTRVERVVWRVQAGKLVLTKGAVPPEVTEASGG